MTLKGLTVELPLAEWDDVRGDRTLLKSTLWLGGVPMHLEAVAVEEKGGDDFLTASAREDEERLQALEEVYTARWETLDIAWPGEEASRRYVMWAVPYGR